MKRSAAFVFCLFLCQVYVYGRADSATVSSERRTTDYLSEKFDDDEIKRVHLVFMNHLDVGYDGIFPTVGYAVNVINKYFDEYFPRAAAVASRLRSLGYVERFIYTTHSWLIDLYTDCPAWTLNTGSLHCPNSSMLAVVENAIRQGDITWHAAPMNMQYEMYSSLLLDLSLNVSSRLDRRFNITRKNTVLSLRDVPGLTKAVIPILQKHNISGVSVGTNHAAPPPAVPPYPFLWKLNQEDTSGVVAFWHQGGYPMGPGMFPNAPGGLSRHDCHITQRVSQFPEALCFAFRQDNQGPPTNITEVLANFEVSRGQFMKAKVQGSTLEGYVSALLAAKSTLPVSSQEVGDPWIHGVSSDPLKTASYRAVLRVLDACFESGNCSLEDPRVINAVRYLTKIPEHTWGLIRISDGDKNFTNAHFRQARAMGNYSNWELSWAEQRQFLNLYVMALEDHPMVQQIGEEYRQLKAEVHDLEGYEKSSVGEQFTCADGTVLQFGSDGALYKMYDAYNKIAWADDDHPIGRIVYSTYNKSAFVDLKTSETPVGVRESDRMEDYGSSPYPSKEWPLKVQTLFRKTAVTQSCDFWLVLMPEDPDAVTLYGSPAMFYIHLVSRPKEGANDPGLDLVVQWFDKQPTRYTESISLHVQPVMPPNGTWHLSKLGQMIEPEEVVDNGNHYTHAVDSTVCLMTEQMSGLEFYTPDVALVMLGTATRPLGPFPQPYGPIGGPVTQMGFNLFNNMWKTNYLFWYPFDDRERSFQARFSVNFVTMSPKV